MRALLVVVGIAAAWSLLAPGVGLRATTDTPPPAATSPADAAASAECSDYVADLPPCATCDGPFIDGEPAARTLDDGTVIERLGDLTYDPPGCNPAKYQP